MVMYDYYNEKNVLITGSSSGIGAGIAKYLAHCGAHVILVARREKQLNAVVSDICVDGGSATSFLCDLTDENSIKEVVRKVKTQYGQLHLLVNNAGIDMVAPLIATNTDRANELFKINVLSMITVTKSFLNLLPAGASIINMASSAGIQGVPAMSIYSASKGAIISFTRSLAKELAAYGIRVNAIAPGIVTTALQDRMFSKLSSTQIAAIEASHPLGFGTVDDIAAAVAFLGGTSARWITGHTLVVDGGLTA